MSVSFLSTHAAVFTFMTAVHIVQQSQVGFGFSLEFLHLHISLWSVPTLALIGSDTAPLGVNSL